MSLQSSPAAAAADLVIYSHCLELILRMFQVHAATILNIPEQSEDKNKYRQFVFVF